MNNNKSAYKKCKQCGQQFYKNYNRQYCKQCAKERKKQRDKKADQRYKAKQNKRMVTSRSYLCSICGKKTFTKYPNKPKTITKQQTYEIRKYRLCKKCWCSISGKTNTNVLKKDPSRKYEILIREIKKRTAQPTAYCNRNKTDGVARWRLTTKKRKKGLP